MYEIFVLRCNTFVSLCQQKTHTMQTMEITPGAQVKVRLFSYKSVRHYGGREINTTPHVCDAVYLFDQTHTKVVELLTDCAGFKKGHKIAVDNKEFNL